ncbi:MAG: lysine--tRNA ligase [Thermoproteota archaeon]|nr:lysine--tRNA ligase [Thermoproteota archaeon]
MDIDASNTENVIGKGTWLDKLAFTLIEREKKIGRSLTNTINVESGLGASGFPHIGSMGDAVRAFGISLALRNMGYKSELIAFSDDLDGLRKVPQGLPSWLEEYLCKPVSSVPDPFGDCHESYGQHMSGLLLEGLDNVGVKYKFKSGTEVYSSGLLKNQIDTILSNSKLIGDHIALSAGQEKYKKYLPFFPICQQCNRLYVANATEYIPDEKAVAYECSGNTINKKHVQGCGNKGEVKIDAGQGKLAWKVEFAARWQALNIRFEAFGKDIMDSVRINDWVSSEILGFHHPLHVKYEMFLDKGGKKISKSSGNVLTPQMWLNYGTPQSLLLLLYKRIAGTRHVGIEDIPMLMDEYDLYEDVYFGKVKENNKSKLLKVKGIYEYINGLSPPTQSQIHVPYRILIQQSQLFIDQKVDTVDKVYERLKKYNLVKEPNDELTRRIMLSIEWAKEFKDSVMYTELETEGEAGYNLKKDDGHASKYTAASRYGIEEKYRKAMLEVLSGLRSITSKIEEGNEKATMTESTTANGENQSPDLSQEVQNMIFNKAKGNGLEPRELFKSFYKVLINSDRGPRLGNYIVDLGIDNVTRMVERKIK